MPSDFQDFGVRSISHENCERAAEMIRVKLGLNEAEPIPGIAGVLTSLNLECIIRANHEMVSTDAYAMPDNREIYFKQEVYERVLLNEESARFVSMHEVVHVFLHAGQARFFKMTGGNVLLPFLTEDTSAETQADRIARAALMPRAMVNAVADPVALASLARVPIKEALQRIDELGCHKARTTPPQISAAIAKQKEIAKEGAGFRRAKSALKPDTEARLLWDLAPTTDDPAEEFRCIDRYTIRWSRRDMMKPAGWRVLNGRIVPWESESNK